MEAPISPERREWGMRHRYDQETKERAVRMFEKRREEQPEESRKQALKHLGGLIGVPPDTIRGWVDRARVDAGEKPGVTTAEREEIRALRKELAEVKRANEILKTASAFFAAAELDRRLK
jgi:transposase